MSNKIYNQQLLTKLQDAVKLKDWETFLNAGINFYTVIGESSSKNLALILEAVENNNEEERNKLMYTELIVIQNKMMSER